VLLVRGGTYDETLVNSQYGLQIPSGTSWANKVRIAAYPGETVWMRPTSADRVVFLATNSQYIEFDGINMDATSTVFGNVAIGESSDPSLSMPHHIRMQNAELIDANHGNGGVITAGAHKIAGDGSGAIGANEFVNLKIHGGGIAGGCGVPCMDYGIYLAGPNNLADSCEIYDTGGAGIHIYNVGGDSADNNIVRNNRIHDIRRSGDIRIWGILVAGNNTQIANNTLYNVGRSDTVGAAIDIYFGQGTVVENNTVSRSQVGIYVEPAASNTVLRSNMISDNVMDYVDQGVNTSSR
jgi:parallel beta-helix repeat protein